MMSAVAASGGNDGEVGRLGKRARSSTASSSLDNTALASHLPQDLIDEIVDCVADGTDLVGLLRLRAVSSMWARAVQAASLNDWFYHWFCVNRSYYQNELSSVADSGNPIWRVIHRQYLFELRIQLVLWRTCERAILNLGNSNDAATFEGLLAPIVVPCCQPVTHDRHQLRLTFLRPLSPIITTLDLADSGTEAVNNDTMRRLAGLLPALRGLGVRNCRGVTDINSFEKHGLTELDISGECGVDTTGMAQLLYIKHFFAARRQPVRLDRFAGRLTELVVSNCSVRYEAFASPHPSSGTSVLLSSKRCVLQRLTKLDASHTQFPCRELLSVTPALTDLKLTGVSRRLREPSDEHDDLGDEIEIPPGVPLRRLSLKWFDLELSGLRNCADTLTWLDLQGCDTIRNDALVDLRALRWLNITGCPIASLGPFVATLTTLTARGETVSITDASLADARELRSLDVSHNPNVTSILPFAATLTELGADGATGLAGVDLSIAPHLTKLSAGGADCVITDTHVLHCASLKRLQCVGNDSITTIRPFIETLEVLEGADNIPQDEIDAAPRLTYCA